MNNYSDKTLESQGKNDFDILLDEAERSLSELDNAKSDDKVYEISRTANEKIEKALSFFQNIDKQLKELDEKIKQYEELEKEYLNKVDYVDLLFQKLDKLENQNKKLTELIQSFNKKYSDLVDFSREIQQQIKKTEQKRLDKEKENNVLQYILIIVIIILMIGVAIK